MRWCMHRHWPALGGPRLTTKWWKGKCLTYHCHHIREQVIREKYVWHQGAHQAPNRAGNKLKEYQVWELRIVECCQQNTGCCISSYRSSEIYYCCSCDDHHCAGIISRVNLPQRAICSVSFYNKETVSVCVSRGYGAFHSPQSFIQPHRALYCLTEPDRASQSLILPHRASYSLTEPDRASQSLIQPHRASYSLTELCRVSQRFAESRRADRASLTH